MNANKPSTKVISVLLAACVMIGSIILPSINVMASETDFLTTLQQAYASTETGAPVISNITHTGSGSVFEKYEISFDLSAEYNNPFDPDDITVNGVFTYPSGKTVIVPAFYIQPMESTSGKTLLTYNVNMYQHSTTETDGWRIRFSGDTVGQYSFYIEVLDSSGRTAFSDSSAFTLSASDNAGYVRVSESNPEYFETSGNSELFYGSGANIPWVREPFTTDPAYMSYEYFLKRAYDEGTNMTRVWMCHYAWLEWMPNESDSTTYSYAGLGYYNQNIAEAMDRIFEMSEEYDLKIVLCLEDNDEHRGDGSYANWAYNPYNTANGGPATDTTDYWANEAVREYYKKRIRYIVARWGYSTSLFSLNMWNDMSSVNDVNIIYYLQELYDYKNSVTANYRPLLMGSNFNGSIADADGNILKADDIFDYTTQHLTMNDGSKPNITQECFASSLDNNNYFRTSLHDVIWDEFMRGGASTMQWDNNAIDATDAWNDFANILKFIRDIPLNKQTYVPSTSYGESGELTLNDSVVPFKIVEAQAYGDVPGFGAVATENQFTINYEDSNLYLVGYNNVLYGNNADRVVWKNAPTFNIYAPNGGQMLLHINNCGSGTNILTATVNGTVQELGRWSTNQDSLDAYVSIDLAVGQNTVKLDNTGHDWMNLDKIYVVFNVISNSDMINIKTLSAPDQVIAYIYNTTYNYLYNGLLGLNSVDLTDVDVTFDNLEDTIYEVEVFDPSTGRFIYTVDSSTYDGKLKVDLPQYDGTVSAIQLKLDTPSADDTAFSFSVDAGGVGSAMSIRGCFSGSGEYRNTGGSTPYYLVSQDGTIQECTFAGERFSIPAGFVGDVVIPFSGFGGGGTMSTENLSTAAQLYFTFYIFDVTTDNNTLIIGDVDFMKDRPEEVITVPAVPGYINTQNAQNFSDMTDSNVTEYVSTWINSGDTVAPTFEITDDGALQVNTIANTNFTVIELQNNQYIPQANGISAYVDTTGRTSNTNVRLFINFEGKALSSWYGNTYYFLPDGGTEEDIVTYTTSGNTQWNSWVSFPAGQKGTYFFPFQVFTVPDSQYDSVGDSYKTSPSEMHSNPISYVQFQISGINSVPFIIDDITFTTPYGVWGEVEEVIPYVFGGNAIEFTDYSSLLSQSKISCWGAISSTSNVSLTDCKLTVNLPYLQHDMALRITEKKDLRVQFVDPAGQVIETVYVDAGAALTEDDIPALPYRPGYIISGWNSIINTVINSDTVVYPVYEKDSSLSFQITCEGGTVAYPEGKTYANFEDIVTLTAPESSDGSAFSHWEIDGIRVSSQNPYSLKVTDNITVVAVYGNASVGTPGVVLNGSAILTYFNDDEFKFSLTGQYYIPDGYTLAEAGILLTNGDLSGNSDEFSGKVRSGAFRTVGNIDLDNFIIENGQLTMVSPGAEKIGWGLDITVPDTDSTVVAIDLDASESTVAVRLVPYFSNGTVTLICMPNSTIYLRYANGTNASLTVGTNGSVTLPVGFVGTLYIMMHTFESTASFSADDFASCNTLVFGMTSDNMEAGDKLTFDSIAYSDTVDGVIFADIESPSAITGYAKDMWQNFDTATNDTISSYASTWNHSGYTPTLSITDDKRLAIACSDTVHSYATIKSSETFTSDAKGLSIRIDASSQTAARSFRLQISGTSVSGQSATLMPWFGRTYYIKSDASSSAEQCTVSGSTQWSSWLNIPAGFVGEVFVPFEAFTVPDSVTDAGAQYCVNPYDLVGMSISGITFQQTGVDTAGDIIYLDDVCWLYEIENELNYSPLNDGFIQKAAQDFSGATTDNLTQHVTVNSGTTVTLTDAGSITVTRSDSQTAYVTVKPQTTYSSSADGFSFHYDASQFTADKGFRIYFHASLNGTNYTLMPWYGRTYYFLPDGEDAVLEERTVSGSGQWSSWLNAKAGTSGTYYIPFDCLMPPENLVSETSVISVASSYNMDPRAFADLTITDIQIMQSGLSGATVSFDDFMWVYDSMFTDVNTVESFGSDMYIGNSEMDLLKIPVYSAYSNEQFVFTSDVLEVGSEYSARAYIIVKDTQNQLKTIYSDRVISV